MAGYLKNAWYAAALSSEVTTDALLGRTILEQPVLLFRDRAGAAVALVDRCPHRFAPLHHGSVRDGIVECPYHGLQFDSGGRCVHNPHGDQHIPDRAVTGNYPVVERQGLIWIWPGDASLADPAKLLDLDAIADPEPHAVCSGYMLTESNYELVVDNLMDLSHADYIHKASLNTGGALSKVRPKVRTIGETIEAYWEYQADKAQPIHLSALPHPEAPVEQSFRMLWHAPCNLLLWVRIRNLHADPDTTAETVTAHFLTPETDATTHYFFVNKRNWDKGNAALNDMMSQGIGYAFVSEDKPILQAVQTSMGGRGFWDMQPLILSCDPGAIHARRMLARLIAREAGAGATADAAEHAG